MANVESLGPNGPYKVGAIAYHESGWTPLPLPPRKKQSPPSGWTGGNKPHSGEHPSVDQVMEWIRSQGSGNICFRLPKNVIGIDVDMYDGKRGRQTLAEAEERWGKLPATWFSSARSDGSGIRLFRIPEGLAWDDRVRSEEGGKDSGIELIRWDHRYALVYPSINPGTDTSYAWFNADGVSNKDEFPAPDDLPWLPDAWVQGLTGGRKWVARGEADLTDSEAQSWISARPSGVPCDEMKAAKDRFLSSLKGAGESGGAHDAGRDAAWILLKSARSGHPGLVTVLVEAREAFFLAVEGRRDSRYQAECEWARIVQDGVRKVVAETGPDRPLKESCSCGSLSDWSPKAGAGVGSGAEVPGAGRRGLGPSDCTVDDVLDGQRTDYWNAKKFLKACGGDLRYNSLLGKGGTWFTYDGTTWNSGNSQVHMWAQSWTDSALLAAKKYMDECAEEGKADSGKPYANWFQTTARSGGVSNLLREARVQVDGPSSDWNYNRRLLVCPNGTLELNPSGPVFRNNRSSDLATIHSKTKYVPGQRSDLWEKFLAQAVPAGMHDWLQRAVGYSMTGLPEDRTLFFLHGPTASGKSTFTRILDQTLGEYSGPFPMSILREKLDEGGRPDIINVMHKRFIFASELSSEHRLHPDMIKRLVGGDVLTARALNSNEYVSAIPEFTPWIATNDIPTIEGSDPATWQRLICVPFPNTVSDSDKVPYAELLNTEEGRSAVLAWCVEGWRRYREVGTIRDFPEEVVEATMGMREGLSELDIFLAENCDVGPDRRVNPTELYSFYEAWQSLNGDPKNKLSQHKFGRRLKAREILRVKARTDGDLGWWYLGVSMKTGTRVW